MTEYKCENCREGHLLAPNARFCPSCGSTSLILLIKELNEPTQKETLGIYTLPNFDVSSVTTEELTREDKPKRRTSSRQ